MSYKTEGESKPTYEFGKGSPEHTVPGLTKSVWQQNRLAQKYPKLTRDLETDVVVVGAGIAGLTCAYLLLKEGACPAQQLPLHLHSHSNAAKPSQ